MTITRQTRRSFYRRVRIKILAFAGPDHPDYGNQPFLAGAVAELRHRNPGMMTLVAMAATVAFVYSVAVIDAKYPETVKATRFGVGVCKEMMFQLYKYILLFRSNSLKYGSFRSLIK